MNDNKNFKKIADNLVDWLKDKVVSAGANGAVVGLSGGIDSAVTARLAQKAFGDNAMGIIMPCNSNREDREDALLFANKFALNYIITDLSDVYQHLLDELKRSGIKGNKMAEVNIKPRLRMTSLYYYAASLNYLVIGTDNRSELKIGYFTKYGDGGVDLAPLGSLVKHEVKVLARELKIPEKIINKKPSAGLWSNQTDEDEMGFSYQELDHYILSGEAEKATKEKIERLVQKNEHKLKAVPIPERSDIVVE
ncbi:NAD(+) synthase [Halanaerobium hydrogeniformans]|uniref:NH(3)-dependent NAD(+) synthetase n=1 Tax=Halanaerobium hydrogeniformans TaxID=656519 RepID=E4RJY6_HALHG|nr:NAD(+) synthase [Halanaerobium hydrogeniformans]ADQ15556.1 NAD+ synthetase [Halanaerobium hydrogeniformans]